MASQIACALALITMRYCCVVAAVSMTIVVASCWPVLARQYRRIVSQISQRSAFCSAVRRTSRSTSDLSLERRFAVNHDEGPRNWLSVGSGKIRADKALHVLYQRDDSLPAGDVSDHLGGVRQRCARIDAADAGEKSLTRMDQYLGSFAGRVELETGLRQCGRAFGILETERLVFSAVLSRERITSLLDALSILGRLVGTGAARFCDHAFHARPLLRHAVMEDLVGADRAALSIAGPALLALTNDEHLPAFTFDLHGTSSPASVQDYVFTTAFRLGSSYIIQGYIFFSHTQ